MTWAGQMLGYAYPKTELILRGLLQAYWRCAEPPATVRIGPKLAMLLEEVGNGLQERLGCEFKLDAELGYYDYAFESAP